MGLIYNKDAEEKRIYAAYGYEVFGTENRYEWTYRNDKPSEVCYTTLRILNELGEEIVNERLGNKCIFKDNFDNTIDNLLWWIMKDKPDKYNIDKVIENNLCASGSLFNYRIDNRKTKEEKQIKEKKEIVKKEEQIKHNMHKIKEFCKDNGYIFAKEEYEKYVLLLPLNEKAQSLLLNAEENTDLMKQYIEFARKYPDNNDLKIIYTGKLEEILQYIK